MFYFIIITHDSKVFKGYFIRIIMEMNEINDVAKFLFKNKITSHIDTLDRDFYNGLIIEFHSTFIVIKDRILGPTPISFSSIENIEKFREIKNEGKEIK